VPESDQTAVLHRRCPMVDSDRLLPASALVSVLLQSLARLQSVGLVHSTAVVSSHSAAESLCSAVAAVRYHYFRLKFLNLPETQSLMVSDVAQLVVVWCFSLLRQETVSVYCSSLLVERFRASTSHFHASTV